MRIRSAAPGLRGLALAGLLALGSAPTAVPGPALAQEQAPVAEAAPEEPRSAKPAAIPVAEIASRAEKVAESIRQLETQLAEKASLEPLRAELAELDDTIEARRPGALRILAAGPSLQDLDDLRADWAVLRRQLSDPEEDLRRRATKLGEQLGSLDELQQVWGRTAEAARAASAPREVLELVAATNRALETVREAYAERRNAVLAFQSRAAQQLREVTETLARIDEAREAIVTNILVRDRVPLWLLTRERRADAEAFDRSLAIWLEERAAELREYAMLNGERLVLHALAFLALVWLLRRSRRGMERRAAAAREAGETEDELRRAAREAFYHPVAAALVLALLATRWFHPEAPATLIDVARLLFLIPLVVVVRGLFDPSLRPVLYGVAVFYLVDGVREVLASFPVLERLLFLAEMAAGALGIAWLLRSARLAKLPVSARGSGWFRIVGFFAQVALGALALAFAAAALGYMRLGLFLGSAVLWAAYAALGLYAGVRIAEGLAVAIFRGRQLRRLRLVRNRPDVFVRGARRGLRVVAVVWWVVSMLNVLAMREPLFHWTSAALSARLGYGSVSMSPGGILAFVLTLYAAWLSARAVALILDEEVYPRLSLPRGVPFAFSAIARYAMLALGFVLALGLLGFNLDRVTLLVGAFGVGLGFGLQNVVNNFVSGLILLFERPIHVGDRVQLEATLGRVTRIGIRSSTVRTVDGADVIVPNGDLISRSVTNWTLGDRLRRIILPVGVAYGTDPERVIAALERVMDAEASVKRDPQPCVLFVGFGNSSLDFEIRVWVDQDDDWPAVQSRLAVGTNAVLKQEGIEIPFPQRDLHVRSVSPEVSRSFFPLGEEREPRP